MHALKVSETPADPFVSSGSGIIVVVERISFQVQKQVRITTTTNASFIGPVLLIGRRM